MAALNVPVIKLISTVTGLWTVFAHRVLRSFATLQSNRGHKLWQASYIVGSCRLFSCLNSCCRLLWKQHWSCTSVCRKAKMMFGLKVKKKKKKDGTDLVLANKGALGKAWKINTPTHKLTILVPCTLWTIESFCLWYRSPCQTVAWWMLVYTAGDSNGHQAWAHLRCSCSLYICFHVDSEAAAPPEASLLLDEEAPEDQPGVSEVSARVIPNNKRC